MQPAKQVCEHPVTDIFNLETASHVSHAYTEVPPELADDYSQEPGDLFDPGPTDPEKKPDLYPSLTPVKNSTAAFPITAQVLVNSYPPPPMIFLLDLLWQSH